MATAEQPGGGFASPQEEVLLTLMRTSDRLHREFQQRLKPHGLTLAQYNVLRILRGAGEPGLSCSAIGRMMITPAPDMTRLLARLEKQGLLRQERDAGDRRVVWTRLTAAGQKLVRELDAVVETAPRELFAGLSCDEVRELTRLLNKAVAPMAGKQNGDSEEPPRRDLVLMEPVTGKRPWAGSPLRPRPE